MDARVSAGPLGKMRHPIAVFLVAGLFWSAGLSVCSAQDKDNNQPNQGPNSAASQSQALQQKMQALLHQGRPPSQEQISDITRQMQALNQQAQMGIAPTIQRMQTCLSSEMEWIKGHCRAPEIARVLSQCTMCGMFKGGDICMKTGSFPSNLEFRSPPAASDSRPSAALNLVEIMQIAQSSGAYGCQMSGSMAPRKFCDGVAVPAGADPVTRHRPNQDTARSSVYTSFSAKELLDDEAKLNQQGEWLLDDTKSCTMGWGSKLLVDFGLSQPVTVVRKHSATIQNYCGVVQTNTNSLVTDLMTFAAEQRGGQCATAKAIYDHLQKSFVQNQARGSSLSMADAVQCGCGVCRHGAVLLAETLKANAIDASVVFSAHHAWVRAVIDGKTVDLDPNAYQDFLPVPPRKVNACQVIPVP